MTIQTQWWKQCLYEDSQDSQTSTITQTESHDMSKVEANICIDNIDEYSDINGNLSFEELINKHCKESVFHSSTVDTRNIDSSPTTICQHCADQMSIQLITETNPLSTHQVQNYLEQECHSASEWSNELFFVDQLMRQITYQ